jgi:hypothetical protein
MNNSKLTITLDFKGRDELEQIVAEIGKQHNIPVDIDISSAKKGWCWCIKTCTSTKTATLRNS